jgi:hypothetical protein
MATAERIIPEKIGDKYYIRNSKTGDLMHIAGYGSMKGKIVLDPDIDLTKPIWEQVYKKQEKMLAQAKAAKRKKKAA